MKTGEDDGNDQVHHNHRHHVALLHQRNSGLIIGEIYHAVVYTLTTCYQFTWPGETPCKIITFPCSIISGLVTESCLVWSLVL